ncbi:MAG TPA: hypothetical protein DDX92_13930 [Flavobacteriales bacterium]|jgi:hypothetical protein|nr:hypothetical protein [Flavobacteriales bacterium]
MKPEEIDKLYRSIYDKQSFAFEEKHWAAFKNQRQGRSYFSSWPFLFVYVFSGMFAAFMLFTTSNIPNASKISTAGIDSKNASDPSSIRTSVRLDVEPSINSNTNPPVNPNTIESTYETSQSGKSTIRDRTAIHNPNEFELIASNEEETHRHRDRQMYFALSSLPAYQGNSAIPVEWKQQLLSRQIGLSDFKIENHTEQDRVFTESDQTTKSSTSAEEMFDYDENIYNGVAFKSAPIAMSTVSTEAPKEKNEGLRKTEEQDAETPESITELDESNREEFVGLSRMRIKTPSINMPDWKFRVSKGKNHWGGLPRLARPLNFKAFAGHYWGMSYDVPLSLSEVNNQPYMQNVEVLVELIVRNRISFQGGLGFSNIYEQQTYDWIETSGNQQRIEEELKISALNIPVNVNYNLSFWRMHWKMGTGFTVGIVMNSQGKLVDPRENPPLLEPNNTFYNTFYMDWNFYNEIGMLITDHWALTLKPEVKVNINSMYTSSFWLPRKNLYYGVGFGIIYSW